MDEQKRQSQTCLQGSGQSSSSNWKGKQTLSDYKQVGGEHYKNNVIEPWNFIAANNLGYFEGSAIKYITRWRSKGGIADIQKAIHFLEKLIELESASKSSTPTGDVVAGGTIHRPEAIAQRAAMGFSPKSSVDGAIRDTYRPSSDYWQELNKVTTDWVTGLHERNLYHGG